MRTWMNGGISIDQLLLYSYLFSFLFFSFGFYQSFSWHSSFFFFFFLYFLFVCSLPGIYILSDRTNFGTVPKATLVETSERRGVVERVILGFSQRMDINAILNCQVLLLLLAANTYVANLVIWHSLLISAFISNRCWCLWLVEKIITSCCCGLVSSLTFIHVRVACKKKKKITSGCCGLVLRGLFVNLVKKIITSCCCGLVLRGLFVNLHPWLIRLLVSRSIHAFGRDRLRLPRFTAI